MSRRSPIPWLLLCLPGVACSGTPKSAEPPAPIAVTANPAAVVTWPVRIEAGGVVRARLTASLSSRILAPVLSVGVRAGDRIAKGQSLIQLDDAELRANADRAAAALRAARMTAAAAAEEERADTAGLTLARATHERIRALEAERSATKQELDEAVAALAAADARSKAASARTREAESALEAAQAAAQGAAVASGYAALVAPFDGVVVERLIDPGAMAAPGAPLLVLEDPSSLRLEISLDASRAATVRTGQAARVRVDADGAAVDWIDATVAEIARVDPASHAFVVKIALPPHDGWRSGLFGRARVDGPAREALTVPASSLVRRGQLTYVLVAAGGHAELRALSIGDVADERVEVLAGLAPADLVIDRPSPALADGTPVTVRGAAR